MTSTRATFASFFLIVVAIFIALPSHADQPAIITAQMRAEDPRLDKRVSLTLPHVYVGELADALTTTTGIPVEADGRDGAADAVISVFLRDAPVGDAMNALWSYFTYNGGAWSWRRDGAEGKYRYTLYRPMSAQSFAARFRRSIQDAFEDEAKVYLSALRLSPSELRRRAKADPRVGYLLDSPRGRSGLQTFFESVPPEMQAGVLRGEAKPRLSVAELSRSGQEFVRDVWQKNPTYMRQPDGSTAIAPLPGWIEFDAHREGSTVSPSLFIMMEHFGGFGYAGGAPLERATRQRLQKLWLQPGDSTANALGSASLVSPKEGDPAFQDENPMRLRLRQLADSAPVSLIARAPRRTQDITDPGEPYGQKLSAFLSKLEATDPHYLVKWREGVALVDTPTWIYEENHAPWRIVRSIRKSRAGMTGRFTLADLVEVAGSLTESEMRNLADDYPVMSGASGWHELFNAMGRSRSLYDSITSTKGTTVDPILGQLRSIRVLSMSGILEVDLVGARAYIEEVMHQGVPGVQLTIRGRDGAYIRGIGFVNRGSSPMVQQFPTLSPHH